MKRICTVVLGLLMLGVTCSFAQRLDKEPSLPPIPSLEQKKPPYLSDDYRKFTAQKVWQEKQIQKAVEKAKAEREEEERKQAKKRKEVLEAVGGHKKLVPLYEDFQSCAGWRVDFRSNGVEFGIVTAMYSPLDRIIFKTTSPALVVKDFNKHIIVFDKNGKKIFEWNGDSRAHYLVRVTRDKKGKITGWVDGL